MLRIEDLSVQVRLGCLADEREIPQEVRYTVEFRFPHEPAGVRSDEIGDTICYAKVSEKLKDLCARNEFKLIERLAVESYEALQDLASDGILIGLSLHKVRPPVDGLLGGSHYACGDFLL